MSGSHSRNKGRRGEQEVSRILRDWLGEDVTRNWAEQAHHGGADILGIDGWCIEVKRAKTYSRQWWEQTVNQAESVSKRPLLVYRCDGMGRGLPDEEKWLCEMYAHDVMFRKKCQHRVITSLACWMDIYRETIDDI